MIIRYALIYGAFVLSFLATSLVAASDYFETTGIVKSVRETDKTLVGGGRSMFVQLNNEAVYRFPLDTALGIAVGFKVKIYHLKRPSGGEDATACAAKILAFPVNLNGEEILYPADSEVIVVPKQEDGCAFSGSQSNQSLQATPLARLA